MIVVFGGEERHINQTHGCPESRVTCSSVEDRRRSAFQKQNEIGSQRPELFNNLPNGTVVVMSLVCAAVGQIGSDELSISVEKLLSPLGPNGFKFAKVSDVLLN